VYGRVHEDSEHRPRPGCRAQQLFNSLLSVTRPAGEAASTRRIRAFSALLRAPGLGARGAIELIERFGSAEAAAGAGRTALARCGVGASTARWLDRPDEEGLARDIAWAGKPGHHVVAWGEPGYPPLLAEAASPPPALFVTGDPALLLRPQLAVVGSRNPTATGREIARTFAGFAAGAGLAITSGLALGIDAEAHAGTLDGNGATIAVMGTGPDRIYPRRHVELAGRIAEHGALVTEFPPGTPPLREHFPRRNRIISALSLGTLVVEAALGSGSLITARYAAEQGREVFAVPGSVLSPLSRGCHALIRDGATLVERPSDILDALGPAAAAPAAVQPFDETPPPAEPDSEYGVLLDAVGFSPVTADTVADRTGLTPQAVSSMLLILELRGEIEALPGARYARTRGHPGT